MEIYLSCYQYHLYNINVFFKGIYNCVLLLSFSFSIPHSYSSL